MFIAYRSTLHHMFRRYFVLDTIFFFLTNDKPAITATLAENNASKKTFLKP